MRPRLAHLLQRLLREGRWGDGARWRRPLTFTGYREGDVLGKPIAVLLRNAGESLSRSKICDGLSGRGEWCGEIELMRRNGETFPAWTAIGCLSGAGCEEIQGYYFSRPLPANEFAALLLHTNQ